MGDARRTAGSHVMRVGRTGRAHRRWLRDARACKAVQVALQPGDGRVAGAGRPGVAKRLVMACFLGVGLTGCAGTGGGGLIRRDAELFLEAAAETREAMNDRGWPGGIRTRRTAIGDVRFDGAEARKRVPAFSVARALLRGVGLGGNENCAQGSRTEMQ